MMLGSKAFNPNIMHFVLIEMIISNFSSAGVNMNQINYQELPEQYGRLLWTIAAGILAGVGTREDVEDIIADVFFSLFERPEQFDPRRGSLKTWLCLKTKSMSIDWIRKNRRLIPLETLTEKERSAGPETGYQREMEMDPTFRDYHQKQQMAQAAAWIAGCGEPDREILKLRFLYELKPSEISLKTGNSIYHRSFFISTFMDISKYI